MRKCPICSNPAPKTDNPYRPFCSKRCRDIDLGAWIDEEYIIPGRDLGSELPDEELPQASPNGHRNGHNGRGYEQ